MMKAERPHLVYPVFTAAVWTALTAALILATPALSLAPLFDKDMHATFSVGLTGLQITSAIVVIIVAILAVEPPRPRFSRSVACNIATKMEKDECAPPSAHATSPPNLTRKNALLPKNNSRGSLLNSYDSAPRLNRGIFSPPRPNSSH